MSGAQVRFHTRVARVHVRLHYIPVRQRPVVAPGRAAQQVRVRRRRRRRPAAAAATAPPSRRPIHAELYGIRHENRADYRRRPALRFRRRLPQGRPVRQQDHRVQGRVGELPDPVETVQVRRRSADHHHTEADRPHHGQPAHVHRRRFEFRDRRADGRQRHRSVGRQRQEGRVHGRRHVGQLVPETILQELFVSEFQRLGFGHGRRGHQEKPVPRNRQGRLGRADRSFFGSRSLRPQVRSEPQRNGEETDRN